mmetsp:Transcript_302/g.734  ORF Transcript_302/g.734 Transcript_302/m.734 type:complete len:155 (+) Transcript_302:71-535(+)
MSLVRKLAPAAPLRKAPIRTLMQSNEDLLHCDDELDSMPKRQLLKCGVHVRLPELKKLTEQTYMEQFRYSVGVISLAEDSKFSGLGDKRGYIVWIYFESVHEEVLFTALSTIGVYLKDREIEVVDPESELVFEQELMYSDEVRKINLMEYSVQA